MGRLQRFKDHLDGKQSEEQKEDILKQKLLENSTAILNAIERLSAPDLTTLASKVDIAGFKRDLETLNNKKIDFKIEPKIAAPNLKPILKAVQNIEVNPVVRTDLSAVNQKLDDFLKEMKKTVSKKEFKFEIVRNDFDERIKEVVATEI